MAGWVDGRVDGWVDGWIPFTSILVVDAENASQSLSLPMSNSSPFSYNCFSNDPTIGRRCPPLPPWGNCQIQPARQGPPAAAVSHHCSAASPPECLSKAADKIDALSGCAWERNAGIRATGMLWRWEVGRRILKPEGFLSLGSIEGTKGGI